MNHRPSLQVAVVMRRERVPGDMSRWQPWRWVLHDVTGHDVLPHAEHFGTEPRCLRQTEDEHHQQTADDQQQAGPVLHAFVIQPIHERMQCHGEKQREEYQQQQRPQAVPRQRELRGAAHDGDPGVARSGSRPGSGSGTCVVGAGM